MFKYEYIHKDDVAIFSLSRKDQIVYLDFADEKLCELIQLKYPLEYSIPTNEILPKQLSSRIDSIIKNLSNEYEVYRTYYDHKLLKKIVPLFVTLIFVSHRTRPRILGYVQVLEGHTSQHFTRLSEDIRDTFYNASLDSVFSIYFKDNNAILASYNETFQQYFLAYNMKLENRKLAQLFPPYICNFIRENSLLAIDHNKSFSKKLDFKYSSDEIKTYLHPESNKLSSLISFYPIVQPSLKGVLCCTKDLSIESELYKNNAALLEEYNSLFYNTTNAAVVFLLHPDLSSTIERINQQMESLLHQLPTLDTQHIGQYKLIQTVIFSKKSMKHSISIKHNNSTYHYNLNIIPLIREEEVYKIIITAVDTTEQIKKELLQKVTLTKREREIISYVIRGEKNSYIAEKLFISIGTVKRTLSNAYSKLGICSRVELIRYYHDPNTL